jgi:hypothetical protein
MDRIYQIRIEGRKNTRRSENNLLEIGRANAILLENDIKVLHWMQQAIRKR